MFFLCNKILSRQIISENGIHPRFANGVSVFSPQQKRRRKIEYQSRIGKVKEIIKSKKMAALMVFSPADLYYLSGYYPHMPWYPEDLFRLTPENPMAEIMTGRHRYHVRRTYMAFKAG